VFRRKRKAEGPAEAPESASGAGAGAPPAQRPRTAADPAPAAPGPSSGAAAEDDPSVPEYLRPLLRALPAGASHRDRLNGLCGSIAAQIQQSLELYRSAMPETVDFDGLEGAYGEILGKWTRRVAEAAEASQILFPGDIEAGGDPGELDAEARAAMMRALRDRLRAEEREWEALSDSSREAVDKARQDRARAEESRRRAVAHAQAEARSGSQAGVLGRTFAEAHRRAALEVDGLTAMVTGVEGMVRRAERACNLMQQELVDDRFRGLSHVDSPATLIRQLTRR